ncbi:hypothetical protein [Yersinia rochesterensis]|uniref:hypothetical protein n=1 Tax=Yersinia rochesterensis TaxID=1604335 RepID=UPI0013C53588|nr:hypothetical protein [Yersinia rochesterensis]
MSPEKLFPGDCGRSFQHFVEKQNSNAEKQNSNFIAVKKQNAEKQKARRSAGESPEKRTGIEKI